jgi:hypothetical protein
MIQIDLVDAKTIIPSSLKECLRPGHVTHTAVGPLPYVLIAVEATIAEPPPATLRVIRELQVGDWHDVAVIAKGECELESMG